MPFSKIRYKGRGSDLDAVKPDDWEAPEKSFGVVTSRIPCDKPNYSNPPRETKYCCDYPEHNLPQDINVEAIAAMPKVFIDAVELCIKKSQDYNNGQDKPASRKEYFSFGLLSYAQMLHTKTQRLNSLAQQTKAPNHESIRDTLIDLINSTCFFSTIIISSAAFPTLSCIHRRYIYCFT